jgi:hypothetical protein
VNDKMTFVVDDDISIVPLVEALNAAGLTISNIGGFRFRVHRLPGLPNVVSLAARRQRDRITDAQIRSGMRLLATESPTDPGAA